VEIDDLRTLSDEDLATDLYETHREMMNLRFRAATMQLSNMNEIGRARRRIARIKTLMTERRRAGAVT
jgi:large subunit ribosomal protein L29